MANRKGFLIGFGPTGRRKPENNLRREPDFEYLAGTWERARKGAPVREGTGSRG